MRRFWVRLFTLFRSLSRFFRRLGLRLRFGQRAIPGDLKLASGVRVSVTDNAHLSIQAGCDIDTNATLIVKYGELEIGEGSYIGVGTVLCARDSVKIGKNVLIAEYVSIRDQDHQLESYNSSTERDFITKPITIGDNVWLGAKVTVTKGVSIGNNSVIGANSVVTKDIPANVLAVGSPAHIVRQLDVKLS